MTIIKQVDNLADTFGELEDIYSEYLGYEKDLVKEIYENDKQISDITENDEKYDNDFNNNGINNENLSVSTKPMNLGALKTTIRIIINVGEFLLGTDAVKEALLPYNFLSGNVDGVDNSRLYGYSNPMASERVDVEENLLGIIGLDKDLIQLISEISRNDSFSFNEFGTIIAQYGMTVDSLEEFVTGIDFAKYAYKEILMGDFSPSERVEIMGGILDSYKMNFKEGLGINELKNYLPIWYEKVERESEHFNVEIGDFQHRNKNYNDLFKEIVDERYYDNELYTVERFFQWRVDAEARVDKDNQFKVSNILKDYEKEYDEIKIPYEHAYRRQQDVELVDNLKHYLDKDLKELKKFIEFWLTDFVDSAICYKTTDNFPNELKDYLNGENITGNYYEFDYEKNDNNQLHIHSYSYMDQEYVRIDDSINDFYLEQIIKSVDSIEQNDSLIEGIPIHESLEVRPINLKNDLNIPVFSLARTLDIDLLTIGAQDYSEKLIKNSNYDSWGDLQFLDSYIRYKNKEHILSFDNKMKNKSTTSFYNNGGTEKNFIDNALEIRNLDFKDNVNKSMDNFRAIPVDNSRNGFLSGERNLPANDKTGLDYVELSKKVYSSIEKEFYKLVGDKMEVEVPKIMERIISAESANYSADNVTWV